MTRSIFHFFLFLTSILFGRWASYSIFHPPRQDDLYPAYQSQAMQLNVVDQDNIQTNFILISVDQINSGKPHLQTAWWVAYNPQTPLVLVSLYPAGSESHAWEEEFTRSFNIRSRNGSRQVDPAFLRVLNSHMIPWDGYLIIDNEATFNIVEFMGGVEMAGHLFDGTEVLESLQTSQGDPNAMLTFQANLWQALCWNAFHDTRLDKQDFSASFMEHILTSPNFPPAILDWTSLVSRSRYPSCEIHPTSIQAASLR